MFFPRLATNRGATTSSTRLRSASVSSRKSESSMFVSPPIRKKPRINVIIISSRANVKSICGAKI